MSWFLYPYRFSVPIRRYTSCGDIHISSKNCTALNVPLVFIGNLLRQSIVHLICNDDSESCPFMYTISSALKCVHFRVKWLTVKLTLPRWQDTLHLFFTPCFFIVWPTQRPTYSWDLSFFLPFTFFELREDKFSGNVQEREASIVGQEKGKYFFFFFLTFFAPSHGIDVATVFKQHIVLHPEWKKWSLMNFSFK